MNVSIADKNIMNMILPLTMYIPDVWEVVPMLATVFPHADNVIKRKGSNNWLMWFRDSFPPNPFRENLI